MNCKTEKINFKKNLNKKERDRCCHHIIPSDKLYHINL